VKAWWKIHDKPRGRWRPLMEWGVHFSPEETAMADELNIYKHISYCLVHSCQIPVSSQVCHQGKRIILFSSGLFGENYNKVGDGGNFGSGFVCSGCNLNLQNGYRRTDSINFMHSSFAVRLEWRPGNRPDYSDYIEPVRDFLRWALEEYERRFQEARESTPSDEWLLEEEFDSFSWRTVESGIEVAERKLRVIRR